MYLDCTKNLFLNCVTASFNHFAKHTKFRASIFVHFLIIFIRTDLVFKQCMFPHCRYSSNKLKEKPYSGMYKMEAEGM